MRSTIGLGVIGFGWMGQAHSRSYLRLPTLFADRTYQPRLAICADNVAARREQATESFGFAAATEDWREVIDTDEVDVVVVTAPNMLHVEMVEAASAAGKHVFCEKPVGGTPAQTVRIAERRPGEAGIITGVGYNYRWAPLVLYTRQLLGGRPAGAAHQLPRPLLLDVRQRPDGPAVVAVPRRPRAATASRTDILSHSVDLGHFLVGRRSPRWSGPGDVHPRAAAAQPGGRRHYDRRAARRPDRRGHQRGLRRHALCRLRQRRAGHVRELAGPWSGPRARTAFEVYGTKGSVAWNLEQMNELQVYYRRRGTSAPGYTTVFGGDRFPYHGTFVPGDANSIGFEDLICHRGPRVPAARSWPAEQHRPGFDEALDYVSRAGRLCCAVVRERARGKTWCDCDH